MLPALLYCHIISLLYAKIAEGKRAPLEKRPALKVRLGRKGKRAGFHYHHHHPQAGQPGQLGGKSGAEASLGRRAQAKAGQGCQSEGKAGPATGWPGRLVGWHQGGSLIQRLGLPTACLRCPPRPEQAPLSGLFSFSRQKRSLGKAGLPAWGCLPPASKSQRPTLLRLFPLAGTEPSICITGPPLKNWLLLLARTPPPPH